MIEFQFDESLPSKIIASLMRRGGCPLRWSSQTITRPSVSLVAFPPRMVTRPPQSITTRIFRKIPSSGFCAKSIVSFTRSRPNPDGSFACREKPRCHSKLCTFSTIKTSPLIYWFLRMTRVRYALNFSGC